jgi:hypothetical protein
MQLLRGFAGDVKKMPSTAELSPLVPLRNATFGTRAHRANAAS